ncbi:MAG TPA: hypothetical protein PLA41_00640 [Candidatus Pacearchaeota archaeon]|nr:hypothetical protein [Candidatus Parcubacteria bacterium]HOU45645.1 hypothetical protein [Candidatus Pacearchaeota archaeon]HPM08293.1 hypothetical protein [Candidatus Pacearchaeota archaeon]HQI74574.1 hypothetical protein [Candidatus Pacearchaeota archaeon]
MEYNSQEIKKRYNSLPEELKDLLNSLEEVEILEEICRTHNLLNMFLDIQKHIALVAMDIENFNDFRIYIFSLCKNENEGKTVYQQIFNMIFLPVMHLINKGESKELQSVQTKSKQIEPQDNIPLIDDKDDLLPPEPKEQNIIDQFQKIKSMTNDQRQELSKYSVDNDSPATHRSFDTYREKI